MLSVCMVQFIISCLNDSQLCLAADKLTGDLSLLVNTP